MYGFRSTGVRWRGPALLGLLLAAGVAGSVALLGVGNRVFGAGRPVAAAPPAAPGPYPKLLLALPVILAACLLVGRLARRLGQPRVIGEMAAGILLGPSLLGALWPAGLSWLFPPQVVSAVDVLAQLGLVLFMYGVGAELDLPALRGRSYPAAAVSQVGIVVPFLAGLLLALPMYPRFAPPGVGFPAFALFLAVALSVTAFPVLARILADLGLTGTGLGATALTAAAVGDITAWCLLSVVVATAHGTALAAVGPTVLLTAVFVALMLLAVRPLLARLHATVPATAVLPLLLCGLLLAALATAWIGIHPIFGAFGFGVVTPRGVVPVEQAVARLRDLTTTALLPLFFVQIGLSTRFGLLGASGRLWLWCLAVLLAATAAKWAATAATAYATGLAARESLALGALMNCRGLTELIVLTIGLDLAVITPTLFTILVLTTLVSTALTTPAVRHLTAA